MGWIQNLSCQGPSKEPATDGFVTGALISRRVNNMANLSLFADVIRGEFAKIAVR